MGKYEYKRLKTFRKNIEFIYDNLYNLFKFNIINLKDRIKTKEEISKDIIENYILYMRYYFNDNKKLKV